MVSEPITLKHRQGTESSFGKKGICDKNDGVHEIKAGNKAIVEDAV